MKKIISLALCCIVICLSLTACSGPNADMTEENITATVEATEKALKEFDTDNLKKYVDSATLSTIMGYADKHQQFKDLGKAIFANLEMEVKSIDIENQTVTVSVTNKDLAQAAEEFVTELNSEYSAFQLLSQLNNDNFLDAKLSELRTRIEKSELFPESIEVTLSVTQGKKNLILSFDSNAEDVVSGGALSVIKSIYSVG